MLGIASALLATTAFSLNAPLAHAAVKRGISSTALVAVRNITALALLAPAASLHIPPQAVALVVSSALLGPGLGDYAYFKAIHLSGVATAVTVAYTYIFTSIFFSAALGLEKITVYEIAGSALAFIGIIVALGGAPRSRGGLYGLAASISWGLATTLLRPATQMADPISIAVTRSAALSIAFTPLARFNNATRGGLLYAVASGAVGLGVGGLAFVTAIAHAGVALTVTATSLTPILSQIIDRAVNRSPISPKHLIGAALVTLGIILSVMNN